MLSKEMARAYTRLPIKGHRVDKIKADLKVVFVYQKLYKKAAKIAAKARGLAKITDNNDLLEKVDFSSHEIATGTDQDTLDIIERILNAAEEEDEEEETCSNTSAVLATTMSPSSRPVQEPTPGAYLSVPGRVPTLQSKTRPLASSLVELQTAAPVTDEGPI